MTTTADANSFNWVVPTYHVNVGVSGAAEYMLGKGFDMRDPADPDPTTRTPFDPSTFNTLIENKKIADVVDPASSIGVFNFTYDDSATEQEDASYLYAYFKIAYGFQSFGAALSRAHEEHQKWQSIYLVESNEIHATSLKGGGLTWKSAPASEKINDPAERADQFAREFGSHFVSQITYGFKIVIRATVHSLVTSDKSLLVSSLKAGIGLLSANGALTSEQINYFNQSSVSITANIVSGGTVPDRNLTLTSFAEVAQFLADLKSNRVKIKEGPVRATLSSWWVYLIDFAKTRETFATTYNPAPVAPFGVPKGTVIAWVPPSEMIDMSDNNNYKIRYPDGWHICDGWGNTPKIDERFLYGTIDPRNLGSTGGFTDHTHEITILQTNIIEENIDKGSNKNAAGAGHTHPASASRASSLPPYYRPLWICRQ